MTEQGTTNPSNDLRQAAAQRPHLRDHLQNFKQITGEYPRFTDEVDDNHESDRPNVLYPVGGPIYCHVYGDLGKEIKYYTIEPTLTDEQEEIFNYVREEILQKSATRPAPETEKQYNDRIEELLADTVTVGDGRNQNTGGRIRSFSGRMLNRLRDALDVDNKEITQETYKNIRYRLNRDIVGFGPLEPLMRDPNNEDIHVIGFDEVFVDHSVFGMLDTTVDFGTSEELDSWLRNMGERMGDPVSDSDPIVDSTLPDGSRVNIIYSDDVSVKGPSMTIRQGDETPLTITQITKWGTMSPELAAYLWLALENEQTVFVVGETAGGKTTTLNASLSFIPRDSKIYSAEDTAELLPPHDTWQQLLTRESGDGGSNDIDLFDLVATALRSRPEYIIVGEVRGEEGRMAFQAAQTGHPVMMTFHASDIVSMIQRFTGEPINVPETFMGNADIVLFQNRVKQGNDVLRRVTSVQEIEGYSKGMGGVVTRKMFHWDPVEDEVVFQGMNNSYVLEEQIATLLGYENTRDIYDDLQFRAEIIERMINEDILGYHEVNEAIDRFQRDGIEGLPFDMTRTGQ